MPLTWSDPAKPNDDSSYDHVIAETPLGRITLEWKSWKEYDSTCGHMPWGEFVCEPTVEDAKQSAQAAWDKMIPVLAEFCS